MNFRHDPNRAKSAVLFWNIHAFWSIALFSCIFHYIYIIHVFFWAFVSHRGTPKFSILDWDFPWNQPSSWGYPPWLWKPSFGNGSKVKTPQGQIGLNSTIQLLGYPIPQWPFQEPIHWRYRFRIFQANFQADFFQYAEYSHNMARNLVPYGTHTPCAHHEEHRAAGHGEPPARRAASAQRSAAGDAGVAIEIDSW